MHKIKQLKKKQKQNKSCEASLANDMLSKSKKPKKGKPP